MDHKINKTELLKSVDLFSSLSDEELGEIIDRTYIQHFKRNETVLYEDKSNKFMYIVLTGRVKVSNYTEEGKEIILAIMQRGEYFGEMSLIDGKTTSAEVSALKDSLIAKITKENFYLMLSSHKPSLDNLLQTLCSRFRSKIETIKMLNYNNASQRIIILFEKLSKKYGKTTDGVVELELELTHQEISDMTGLARQTVTKIIDKWKKDKYLSISKQKHICLNRIFFEKTTELSSE